MERQLSAILSSYLRKKAALLCSMERAAKTFLRQAGPWISLKPGSHSRRMARAIIISLIHQVLSRPYLSTSAKRIAARFPQLNNRLRIMTYHQRAMSFVHQKRLPEDGTLDLTVEPQSVRLIYQRLMWARRNLDRLNPPDRTVVGAKPRLAYVSPLPPEQSGISDYSSELLPDLRQYYSIDVIVAQKEVTDSWIRANCSIRDLCWFEQNAHCYDRIIYQLGNSLFHDHMLRLLERYPGIVVLHDFYLGDLISHLELYGGVHGFWTEALYCSHGYHALQTRFNPAKELEAVNNFPVNLSLVQRAQGVIVHSNYARHLAEKHYGQGFARDWSVVPFPRRLPKVIDRNGARKALGFGLNDFVICSFGILGETKLNQHLLNAWLKTPLAADRNCNLVFVGQDSQNSEYCERLRRSINSSSARARIRITGFAAPELYRQYLQAADLAVQLRAFSRGETSAAVFDCLAYGIPTIVNANGAMVELPEGSVFMLPDEFPIEELAAAITMLKDEPGKRQTLGAEARRSAKRHSPDQVVRKYHEAIETITRTAPATADVRALAGRAAQVSAPADDKTWLDLARKMAKEDPSIKGRVRQLLIDVSILARQDFKTGIQRVVRAQLLALLCDPPAGFRVEPVWLGEIGGQWHYRYARQFTLRLLGLPDDVLEDDPVDIASGDIFYMPDFWTNGVILAMETGLYAEWRAIGVEMSFMVYDVLPITRPDLFPDGFGEMHARWLCAVADSADRLICISRAVADQTRRWLQDNRPETLERLDIAVLHLGADIAASAPTVGLPESASFVLDELTSRPSFLMVGTVEPRKGYLQTLAAFEQLWEAGLDINLVIVGAEGWKTVPHEQRRTVPTIVDRLRRHSELGRRLFWLEGISDEYLEKVYACCMCLIAASEDEGFGLPLIEAARHGIPILARDIPVFREVAGEHASYFEGKDPNSLADAVRDWLVLHERGEYPKPDNMPWMTWSKNVECLKAILLPNAPKQVGVLRCPSTDAARLQKN